MDEVLDILKLVAVLFAAYAAGSTFRFFNCPGLIGEIIVGICVGPHAANVVPFPDAFKLAGVLGLVLLVLEGGLHIDIATLKSVWLKAGLIALTGTGLPVLLSWAFMPRFDAFSNREGIVMGTSLSSTAIGMATTFMKDFDLLHTRLGKLICCAAMIDDIASLVLLAIISSTVGNAEDVESGDGAADASINAVVWGPSTGTWAVFIPILTSIGFIVISLAFAVLLPKVIAYARGINFVQRKVNDQLWSRCLLFMLLAYSTGGIAVAHYLRTTFLLGPFMAGVAFSTISPARDQFEHHVSPFCTWFGTVFFVSIGLAVPVESLVNGDAVGYGIILALIAVASKVVTGVFDWANKWVIGWAMVGRGELGFVMAQEAFAKGLTSKLALSVTVWALLTATLVSPIVLRLILNHTRGHA